jgi:hypothetical protein
MTRPTPWYINCIPGFFLWISWKKIRHIN